MKYGYTVKDLIAKIEEEEKVAEITQGLLADSVILDKVSKQLLRSSLVPDKKILDWNVELREKKKRDLVRNSVKVALVNFLKEANVSLLDIFEELAQYKMDRSAHSLVSMLIQKLGVDDDAKKYWIQYFGEYGKLLVEEIKELFKKKKIAVKDCVHLAEWYGRNYGWSCVASTVLTKVSTNVVKGAVEKIAVDDAAKKYWIQYWKDYGEKLVTEYKDLKKSRR